MDKRLAPKGLRQQVPWKGPR